MTSPTILMIGNHLSTTKHNKNIWHYLAERLSVSGWNVITTSSKENKVLRLIDMLWTIIKQRQKYGLAQIDVFSSRAFLYTNFCSFLLKLIRKKIVMTLHGGGLIEFADRHPQRLKRVLSRAAVVVTPSIFLQRNLAFLRNDIHLIPNPIDFSLSNFRHRKSIPSDLIWVRAFNHVYNPNLAVKVIKALEAEFPDIHLIMVGPDTGDGSLAHLKTLAHELNVSHRIEIVGGKPHTEIPDWLSKAAIFINTTNYDAAPRSLIEAMANGLCVVSTNVGGIPYILEHERQGLLVPPDDPEAMANSIKRILTEPGLAERLSISAHARAKQFDWSYILPQWQDLLLGVLQSVTP